MTLVPLGDRVVLKQVEAEETTKSLQHISYGAITRHHKRKNVRKARLFTQM